MVCKHSYYFWSREASVHRDQKRSLIIFFYLFCSVFKGFKFKCYSTVVFQGLRLNIVQENLTRLIKTNLIINTSFSSCDPMLYSGFPAVVGEADS